MVWALEHSRGTKITPESMMTVIKQSQKNWNLVNKYISAVTETIEWEELVA